jgi:fructokinase
LKNITAIGEILYDVYPDEKRLGGAPFNFIYHVWKIIGNAKFVSSVGDDANGNEMLNFLRSIGFDTSYILVDKAHPTGTVKVKLDENKIPSFVISPESSYDYITLNAEIQTLLNDNTEILYLGTLTARSEVSRKTVISTLGSKNVKYFFDLNLRHKFFSVELLEKMLTVGHVIKINEAELDKLINLFNLDSSKNTAVQQLITKFNIDLVAVTLGENGAELYTRDEMNKYNAEPVDIVDSLGAGDAYAAILCLGYLKNFPLAEINKLANEFALEICHVSGALPPDDSVYDKYRKIFYNI